MIRHALVAAGLLLALPAAAQSQQGGQPSRAQPRSQQGQGMDHSNMQGMDRSRMQGGSAPSQRQQQQRPGGSQQNQGRQQQQQQRN